MQTSDEPQLIHLADFSPIENVSNWPDAREVIAKHIPERLEFRISTRSPSTMEVDDEWVRRLLAATPDDPWPTVYRRLITVSETLSRIVPGTRIRATFTGQPMNAESLVRVNAMLAEHDKESEALGYATAVECIAHMMGIAPAAKPVRKAL
jgi:hypothetical protein